MEELPPSPPHVHAATCRRHCLSVCPTTRRRTRVTVFLKKSHLKMNECIVIVFGGVDFFFFFFLRVGGAK